MVADQSDDALRRIIFGRGSSPDEVRLASEELERRTSKKQVMSADEVREEAPAAPDVREERSIADPPAVPAPRRRQWLWFALTAAVAACAGGLTVGTYVGAQRTESAPRPAASTPGIEQLVPSSSTRVTDPTGSRVVYEVPYPTDASSTEGADRWLAATVPEPRPLPEIPGGLRFGASRYIGEVDDLGGVWAARGADGGYCLVLESRSPVGTAASCSTEQAFASRGVYVGTNDYTALWNDTSVIVSMTIR
jgi:hypothetical protein